jgi:CTP synthase
MDRWDGLIHRLRNLEGKVRIGVVGKYVELEDAYKSLREALVHGGIAHGVETVIDWVEAEHLEDPGDVSVLEQYDGILVPGGFGKRGIPGMIRAIGFARRSKVPYFGICLGMQCAVLEFARNVAGIERANSTEFDVNTPEPVIYKLRDLLGVDAIGGTMRLGAYPCELAPESRVRSIYDEEKIAERHRHRYEFNRAFEKRLTDAGLVISGASPDGNFVEVVEIADHPWFIGCQFHPEFKSRPLEPHPLFTSFVGASLENRKRQRRGADVPGESSGKHLKSGEMVAR